MIRNLSRALIVVIVVLHGISAGRSVEAATTVQQDGRDLFQQALLRERADGKLEEAIEIYRRVLDVAADDRGLAAQALVRIGACYDKLGRPEASDTYERVLRDYPDQAEAVAAAQIGLEPPAPSPTTTVRELMRSAELSPGEISDPTNDGTFAVSRDGQLFVYTDWNTGDLVVTNLATGEKRGLYGIEWGQSTEYVGAPVLSADDKKVAYISYPETDDAILRLVVDSIGGGHRETVFDFEDDGFAFLTAHDWSPDGQQILLSWQGADGSAVLAMARLDDKTLHRLVTLDWESPRRAEYSPDGRFIAYDSTKNGDKKIYLLSADGAQEQVLVDSPGEDDSPVWTHDGRFLLFRSDRSGKWDLYALPMENGRPTGDDVLVESNLGGATSLRGVTDEDQLIYHELVGGSDIAIKERITTSTQSGPARILPKIGVTDNARPAFAPEGKRLAYLASTPDGGRPENITIRITDLQGKILKDIPLDRRFASNRPPRFSPDGKTLGLHVYDANSGPKIMVLSAETGAVLKLFSPLAAPGPPGIGRGSFYDLGWSADSQGVYAVRLEDGTRSLALIDVETERVIESTVLPAGFARFSLSPSGEALLMLSAPDRSGGGERTTRLVLRSLVDGSEKLLTEEASFAFGWDFDSRHVLYMKGEWGVDENRLFSLALDTLEETVLLEDTQGIGFPAVSPDGKYWAHHKQQAQSARIRVLENFLPKTAAQAASR